MAAKKKEPTGETKLNVVCSLLTWIQRAKTSAKKRAKLRKFLDTFCEPSDYFSAVRLILPSLDRERGSYGLKESVLATSLVDALGVSRDSPDALRLINWRKAGAKTGLNAGNFPLVAAEVLERRQGMTSGGLTIKELNDLLDRLASSENRAEKTSVLTTLIKKTNAQEMKWIVMIILKDLKLGISEKSIFHEFHPDAEDLFNVTCDLKLVCEKLKDRNQRHKRQDIEVGKAVRPQLAMRVASATAAWKKLHGKEVVIECKFDGDRIQIHKNGSEIHFFSRNFFDHSEYEPAMSRIITQNIVVDRCILDGEMLVWDTSLNRFAEFGSNQEIAKAAKDGLDSDRQLCYVAFDILYVGDTSVIHQSLKERHQLLQKVVNPLKGRLEILIPDAGLNAQRPPGEPRWSFIPQNVDEVERFFKETIENRDEGVVLKDLGSKWEPSDRSGKWMKLKPDYIRAGSDLDVLIIGGYHGSGRRGGEVAQFLVGLAERPSPNAYPRRFMSFCRVGTGLSDDELDAIVTKLKPYFRKYEYPKKAPPSYYKVTNNSKERPDVWIDSPEKSIILSITSDIRTIRSGVFAAPYSLRFPRIDRVKYDKPWHECLDVETFVELVHSSNGTTQREPGNDDLQDGKPQRSKSTRRGDKKNASVIPSHFIQTDVSNVKGETLIFSNMNFYFVNVPPNLSFDSLHKMVAENGGGFSMNMNNSVTHCVAAESKGLKYQAAKLHADIIHYSWVLDCCSQKKLLQLHPKYYLFLSDSTKKKLQEEIDEFSDSYFCDLDLVGIKQLLSNIDRSEDTDIVEYYKKKYCPNDKWSYLHGCCIYFYCSMLPLNTEMDVVSLELALRRLKVEVSMGGGKVCNNLADASHLMVVVEPGLDVDLTTILRSFTVAEKQLLWNKRLHVVRSQWLEECIEMEQKLQEENYSLKPSGLEELAGEQWKHDLEVSSNSYQKESQHFPSPENKVASENPKTLPSLKRDGKKKRGRPTGKTTNRGMNQARRTRPRLAKKRAKISGNESDESDSSEGKAHDEFIGAREGSRETDGISGDDTRSEIQNTELVEDSELSHRNKVVPQQAAAAQETRLEAVFNKAPRIGMRGCQSRDTPQVLDDRVHEKRDLMEKPQKLQVMVDPVHSMLLDMIPSLGMKKVETTNPIPEHEKPSVDDATAEPSKKKKVSYKDVASELLKDW